MVTKWLHTDQCAFKTLSMLNFVQGGFVHCALLGAQVLCAEVVRVLCNQNIHSKKIGYQIGHPSRLWVTQFGWHWNRASSCDTMVATNDARVAKRVDWNQHACLATTIAPNTCHDKMAWLPFGLFVSKIGLLLKSAVIVLPLSKHTISTYLYIYNSYWIPIYYKTPPLNAPK